MVARDAGSARGADHRACQELPGQDLLQYFDEDKELRAVSSDDVNIYLKAITGRAITAKDFRTWAGTVLMARFLKQWGVFESATQAKRALSAAVKQVAAALGIPGRLPQVVYSPRHLQRLSRRRACPRGRRGRGWRVGADIFRPEEAAVLALLSGRQSGAVSL